MAGDARPKRMDCRFNQVEDRPDFVNPAYDDSAWSVGARTMGNPGAPVWFRCKIPVPAGADREGLILDPGRIADVDETYVNGFEVGSTQMMSKLKWPYFFHRNYFVSPELLRGKSEALVTIRATSRSFGAIGFVDHEPYFRDSWEQSDSSVYEFLPFAFIIIFLSLMRLYPFHQEASKARLRALTQMGAGIASVVLLNTFFLYRTLFPLSNIWLRIHVIVTAVSAWLLFRFLDLVLGQNHSRWVTIWTATIGAVAALMPGYTNGDFSTEWTAKLFGIWGIPILLKGIVVCWKVLRNFITERSPASLSLLIGGVALIVLGGWDILELLDGRLPVSMPASGIGFLCFFIGAIFHTIATDRENAVEDIRTEYAAQAAVASLASQVAHDIRSPLAALEMVVADLEAVPEETRILIRDASRRIKDIANHLLAQHREGLKTLPQQLETVSSSEATVEHLASLIEQIVSEKRVQFRSLPELQIEVKAIEKAYACFARVHATEFKRVLSNLINNSVEAIKDSGAVSVRTEAGVTDLRITVEDTGKGIPTDVLRKLGKRGNTHDKATGTGLGLHHALTWIEKWGGRLEIASEPGKGTSVTMTLPRAAAPIWFVPEIRIKQNQLIVALDDDQSIHGIWARRLGASCQLIHLTTGTELENWVRLQHQESEPPLFLVDYELKGEMRTGLDWIETLGLQAHSLLVTSRFEEPSIRARCQQQSIRIVPKSFAAFVPLAFEPSIAVQLPPSKAVWVLIDPDQAIQQRWKTAHPDKVLAFSSYEEFEVRSSELDRTTIIYADSDLKDAIFGEPVDLKLYQMGFSRIRLITSGDTSELPSMPWVEQVVTKEQPLQS